MSFYNFAYTAPFPSDSKITKEQVFEALQHKARDPLEFVPLFVACDVLEETPTFIKRRATTKYGEVLVEDIDLYAPALVTFKADNGMFITNLISETSKGEMLLTSTYSVPLSKDLEPGSEAEAMKKTEIFEMAEVTVNQSVKTTLALFGAGSLN